MTGAADSVGSDDMEVLGSAELDEELLPKINN